jgi:hypothetical protein
MVFRVLSVLTLSVLALAIPNVLTPWLHIDLQHDGVVQSWRDGVEGSVDSLVWITIAGLALHPLARPLLAQLLVVVAAVAATVIPAAGPAMVLTLVLVLLPVLGYPVWGRLQDLRSPRIDRPTAAVAIATAAVVLPLAVAAWSATDNGAATYSEHLAVLAVAGLASSTRRPGWRWVAWPTVAAWAYLGTLAIAFPDEIDSFGTLGGVACLLVAVAFAWLTIRPAGRTSQVFARTTSVV